VKLLLHQRRIVEEAVPVAETEEEITEVVEADHVTVIATITIVTDVIDDHHHIVDHREHLDHVMILMTVQNLE